MGRSWSVLLLATAAAAQPHAVKFSQLGAPNGLVIQGVASGRMLNFAAPLDRVLRSARVNAVFSHSQALIAPSSLTVAVNGTPLRTMALTPQNIDRGVLEAEIPVSLLKDYNRLEFLASQHFTTGCEDPFDASLWTAIGAESQLIFDYGPYKAFPQLNHFPRPLADPLDYRTPVIRVVLARDAPAHAYSAAARLAGGLGRHMVFRAAELSAATTVDPNADAHQVVIGSLSQLNGALAAIRSALKDPKTWTITAPSQLAAGQGYLHLLENPLRSGRFLLLAGGDAVGLAKAVDALLEDPGNRALAATMAVIDRVERKPRPALAHWLPDRDDFTWRELAGPAAAGSATVRGFSPGPIQIPLRAAADTHFVPYEQKLLVNFAYGPQVDTTRSTVEVIINGVSVRGQALTRAAGAGGETLEVNVPQGVLSVDNLVEVYFRLYPRNWNYCERFSNDHLWATLQDTTRFHLPRDRYADLPDLALLRHDGFPLRGGAAWVLPASPEESETSLFLNAAYFVGRTAGEAPATVVFDSAVNDTLRRGSHLLFVGLSGRHALIREASTSLTFEAANRTLRLGRPSATALAAQQVPGAPGVIEQAISVWNQDKLVVLFTGSDPNALDLTRRALHDPRAQARFSGNLVLVESGGEAASFALAETRRFGAIALHRRVKYWVMENLGWVAAGSVLGLLLVFYVLRLLRRHVFKPVIEDPALQQR